MLLVRSHLEIMEYRKEIKYSWQEEGIDPGQTIPPAVLHTLLENGITHSLPREDNSIGFKLVYEESENFIDMKKPVILICYGPYSII